MRVVINAATIAQDLRSQMKKIESGQFTPADIEWFQDLSRAYAKNW